MEQLLILFSQPEHHLTPSKLLYLVSHLSIVILLKLSTPSYKLPRTCTPNHSPQEPDIYRDYRLPRLSLSKCLVVLMAVVMRILIPSLSYSLSLLNALLSNPSYFNFSKIINQSTILPTQSLIFSLSVEESFLQIRVKQCFNEQSHSITLHLNYFFLL